LPRGQLGETGRNSEGKKEGEWATSSVIDRRKEYGKETTSAKENNLSGKKGVRGSNCFSMFFQGGYEAEKEEVLGMTEGETTSNRREKRKKKEEPRRTN